MKLLGSIYIAIAILVVTAAIGWYVDISHEQMHQRHLAVHTQLERMVRLRQELNGMLMVAVLEENTLRASTYPRVYEDLQNTLQSVQQLTQSLGLSDELATVQAEHDKLATIEAQALAAMQLPPAARVAILLPNGLHAMCADQATLATGGVPVPLHAIDNPGSIAYILADCEASMLIVSQAEQWEKIRAVGTPFPALRAVVITDDDDAFKPTPASIDSPAVGSLAQWLTGAAQTGAPTTGMGPQADDLAAIVYTSGTTGKPKGVMLTHRNVVSDVKAVLEHAGVGSSDVFVSWLPLYHDMGLIGAGLGSLYHAFPLVVMSPLSFLARPARWLWAIHAPVGTLSAAPKLVEPVPLAANERRVTQRTAVEKTVAVKAMGPADLTALVPKDSAKKANVDDQRRPDRFNSRGVNCSLYPARCG